MKKINIQRRGVAMFYAIIMMAVLCMILSLAVDYGHAQLVKTELRRTADASARAAIGSLSSGLAAASKSAKDVAKLNSIDGQPCVLDATKDIEYGIWDVNTKKFTPSSDTSNPTTPPGGVPVIKPRIFKASSAGVSLSKPTFSRLSSGESMLVTSYFLFLGKTKT